MEKISHYHSAKSAGTFMQYGHSTRMLVLPVHSISPLKMAFEQTQI